MHLPSFWYAVATKLDVIQCYFKARDHYRDYAKCLLCYSPCELHI
jgi:hypothetical protein